MNLKPYVLTILSILLFTIGCSKNAPDIPPPTEAPPVAVEDTSQPVDDTPKPVVEEAPEPEDLPDVDISKIRMEDVYFDFDKSDLRSDALDVLAGHVEVLKANVDIKVLIEGHCDERGTEEYNQALGERRANRVREYYISSGISANRLRTISYGELRPKAEGSNEAAWALNRRAHFVLSK